MSRAGLKVKGADKLLDKLARLAGDRTAQRVLRRATNAATTPLLKAVKAGTPVDKGSLKKAMAKKVSGKRYTVGGRVGVDTAKMDPDGKHRVARHLHLVENGFEHESGKVVPGAHMLQKGSDASRSQSESAYIRKLADGIEKEAKG